ncbi:hypothetical protein [Catenulispora pinisilvae]|uniref:hypothetical protein n=1 Tax=Catenulispora pinisilvae TaxID=2705253 RepID=UPI001892710D|nr:hypothetical protein [Catenulispora pinisilvae]
MSSSASRRARLSVLALTGAVSALVPAVSAQAATSAAVPAAASTASAASAVAHLKLFAAAPAGLTNPDDITRLGNLVFVTYQNNAGPTGTPAGSKSDVIAFDLGTGRVEGHWTIAGRVDGLTGDPRHHRVIATVNEDLNSTLYTITPGQGDSGLKHYTYFPNPAQTGSDGTNGGTDSVAISRDGTMYVAHSNPDVSLSGADNAPAVYTIKLSGTAAQLTPVFGVDDPATVINPAAGAPKSAPMGLTDPDSNKWVPGPDGGTLIQDSQADSKLIFASDLDAAHPRLRELNLTNATGPASVTPQLDDITPTGAAGRLFIVDQQSGSIYTLDTRGFAGGELFAAQPAPGDGDLANTPGLKLINEKTGVATPVVTDVKLGSPKGLLFVHGHEGRGGGEGWGGGWGHAPGIS